MKLKKIYRFFYNSFGVNKKDNPLLVGEGDWFHLWR